MRRTLTLFVVITLFATPLAAWAFFKPVRIIAPEMTGVTCYDDRICIDDVSRIDEARKLYQDAIEFVRTGVGEIKKLPPAIFCSTRECSSQFGLYTGSYSHAAAYNVGTFGLVISYRGWQPHYLRHELIHHLQNERLGSLNNWFFKPVWLKEGMAYSLSEDPRNPLPADLEAYRNKYEAWYSGIDANNFWTEAAKL